jgi:hypothetical protein
VRVCVYLLGPAAETIVVLRMSVKRVNVMRMGVFIFVVDVLLLQCSTASGGSLASAHLLPVYDCTQQHNREADAREDGCMTVNNTTGEADAREDG